MGAEPGVSAGRDSGCPFCLGRDRAVPMIGERIRILSDFMAGWTGTVVQPHPSMPVLQPGEVVVAMDGDTSGGTFWVNTLREVVETLPATPVPSWAPPISLREAEELDCLVVKFCHESAWKGRGTPNRQVFNQVIGHVWRRRLPIEPREMRLLLEAHGVPPNWHRRLTLRYQEGRDVLIQSVGMKPIRKKRVPPLSSCTVRITVA